MLVLSFWALIISIADIASLAILIYIVGFYSQGTVPIAFKILPKSFQDPKSVSLILVFLILFALKNLGGYLVFRSQYKFVYKVATRLAELNLLQFLEGKFTDYIEIDSSVQVRRISQQPIEFCHYVLAGVQLIITEGLLILLAIVAILFFNDSRSGGDPDVLFDTKKIAIRKTAYKIEQRKNFAILTGSPNRICRE